MSQASWITVLSKSFCTLLRRGQTAAQECGTSIAIHISSLGLKQSSSAWTLHQQFTCQPTGSATWSKFALACSTSWQNTVRSDAFTRNKGHSLYSGWLCWTFAIRLGQGSNSYKRWRHFASLKSQTCCKTNSWTSSGTCHGWRPSLRAAASPRSKLWRIARGLSTWTLPPRCRQWSNSRENSTRCTDLMHPPKRLRQFSLAQSPISSVSNQSIFSKPNSQSRSLVMLCHGLMIHQNLDWTA